MMSKGFEIMKETNLKVHRQGLSQGWIHEGHFISFNFLMKDNCWSVLSAAGAICCIFIIMKTIIINII